MKTPKQENSEDKPQMPFDEALKRVWRSPPAPHVAKKKAPKK